MGCKSCHFGPKGEGMARQGTGKAIAASLKQYQGSSRDAALCRRQKRIMQERIVKLIEQPGLPIMKASAKNK